LTSNSTGTVSAGDVTLVRTASATPTCGVSGCGTMSEPGVGTN
jgi:hypothetical protein